MGEGGHGGGRTHRDRVSLINLELSWLVLVGVHAGRQEVEERSQQVQVFASHIGHLEYRADPTGRER